MFNSNKIVKYAAEYITVEKNKYNSAIYNHSVAITKDERLINIYKTKLLNNEDIPNLQYLIDIKTKSIENHIIRIKHYKYEISILNKIPTRQRSFLYILKLLNFNIQRELLKGGSYLFPFGIGKIRILALTSQPNFEIIDWSASMKNIERIAKEKNIELYNQYKNNEMPKFQFIQAMKTYLYPNSNGQRWIIYNTKKQRFFVKLRLGKLKSINKFSFKFKPTSYANFSRQNLQSLIKNFNTHFDIINNINLGFRTKMSLLEFYYPHIKEYYNDLSND